MKLTLGALSSGGQSSSLTTSRSGVQVPQRPPYLSRREMSALVRLAGIIGWVAGKAAFGGKLHRHHATDSEQAAVLYLGRVTHEKMKAAG